MNPHTFLPLSVLGPGVLTLGLCLGIASVQAQGLDRSSTDIIRSLAPGGGSGSSQAMPETRVLQGVRVERSDNVDVLAPDGRQVRVRIDRARALDFDVFFPFDSAELTPAARRSLAALGTALASSELAGASYLVAGHTDARGSASHNDDLSRRRAQAVRNYLITTFAINPDRLYVAGFGARRLRSPQTPAAAINRRVEIALIVAR